MAKISIVIPVYNSAKTLKQCLDSLLDQTLKDFEVICINDGSKDNSLEILNEYAQKDSRFIVIDKENEGQGVARNLAIQKAQGEYLLCLDADDWLEDNALELAYNKISEDNSEILFFDAYRYIEKENEKYLLKYTETYKNFYNKPFNKNITGKATFMTNGLPYKMYNLNFIKENNITYSSHKFLEDAPFYFKTMLCANSISCLSKPLYNYRVSKSSATFNYQKYLNSIPEVYDICFKIIQQYNVEKDVLESFLINRKNALLYFYSLVPLYAKPKYYKMMQKIIKKHFAKYKLNQELKDITESNFFLYQTRYHYNVLKYIISAYCI